jgi:two-component system alkaline phosphatase synthesis response regulator PhoP
VLTKTDTPPVRVLLVEDDPDLAEVTAELLSSEGLDVRTAVSGREALEIASAFLPQLVLCDLNLPDIDGAQVVRELRSNPATARSFFVLLTAMAVNPRNGAPGEQEVDASISKPITIEVIGSMVKKIGERGLR